jgi:hypothetical protein
MHLVGLIKENMVDVIHAGSKDSFMVTAQLITN